MSELVKLCEELVVLAKSDKVASDRARRWQGHSLAAFYAGRSEAFGDASVWLKRELPRAGADFERGLEVVESEATDDLIELDLALRGLEWAVVNLRESLMDVVGGLVHNLQKGDETDGRAEARSP